MGICNAHYDKEPRKVGHQNRYAYEPGYFAPGLRDHVETIPTYPPWWIGGALKHVAEWGQGCLISELLFLPGRAILGAGMGPGSDQGLARSRANGLRVGGLELPYHDSWLWDRDRLVPLRDHALPRRSCSLPGDDCVGMISRLGLVLLLWGVGEA